jgi:hypothetical protein
MTDAHQATWSDDEVDSRDLLQAIREVREFGADEQRVRAAVEAARDAGVAWGRIADALGVRRGNAYQRYRRRPMDR